MRLKRLKKRIGINTLWVIITDFLSHLFILLTISSFDSMVQSKIGQLDLPSSIWQLSESQVTEFSSAIQGYFYYFLALLIVMIILIIAIWSVSRAMVWKISRKKRLSLKYLLKGMGLGMIWFPIGIIPAILIYTTLKQGTNLILLLIYMTVFVYYSIIIHLNFSKKEKISIIHPIKEASTRIDLPLIFLGLLAGYFILSQILNMLYFISYGWIIAIAAYLFYFAVSRYIFIEKRG